MIKKLGPFWISILATPFLCLLGLFSGGAGHGDYVLATLLFPFSIIFGITIGPFFPCPAFGDCFPRDGIWLATAVIQFPIYGLLFSFIDRKLRLAMLLVIVHICCFVGFWLHFGTLGFH